MDGVNETSRRGESTYLRVTAADESWAMRSLMLARERVRDCRSSGRLSRTECNWLVSRLASSDMERQVNSLKNARRLRAITCQIIRRHVHTLISYKTVATKNEIYDINATSSRGAHCGHRERKLEIAKKKRTQVQRDY